MDWLKILVITTVLAVSNAIADPVPVYDIHDVADPSTNSVEISDDSSPSVMEPALTIDQRLEKLESQVHNLLNGNNARRVNDLQTEIQSLRGHIESLEAKLDNLVNKYNDNYRAAAISVDKPSSQNNKSSNLNISKNQRNKSLTRNQIVTAPKVSSAVVTEKIYGFIKSAKYQQAINYLRGILPQYAGTKFAADMHYWLGDLYSLMGNHRQAKTEFLTVVNSKIKGEYYPDAQVKLGLIYAMHGDNVNARIMFNKVITNFPKSNAAKLALTQLTKLSAHGK